MNFKQWREELCLNQTELAKKVKVSRQTVWNWEHGKSAPEFHHVAELQKISDRYLGRGKINLFDILNNNEIKPPKTTPQQVTDRNVEKSKVSVC